MTPFLVLIGFHYDNFNSRHLQITPSIATIILGIRYYMKKQNKTLFIILKFIRFFLFMGQPKVSLEEARKIAQKVCKQKEWGWSCVCERQYLSTWYFRTNCNMDGLNAIISVNMYTGQVLESHRTPIKIIYD